MDVAIAYDASAPDTGVSWPFVWYLRDYTHQTSFDQPTRSLRDSVIVIVDEKNFDKIEPALGPGFYRMDYIRMWWPMQDYFSLSYDRDASQPFPEDYACKGLLSFMKLAKSKDYTPFCEAFTNPAIRAGIFQIWLNRDYTKYAEAKGRSDLTLTTWNPADKMRLYIRKDVASQIWNYGVAPTVLETAADPTEGKYISLAADLILDITSQDTDPLECAAFARLCKRRHCVCGRFSQPSRGASGHGRKCPARMGHFRRRCKYPGCAMGHSTNPGALQSHLMAQSM